MRAPRSQGPQRVPPRATGPSPSTPRHPVDLRLGTETSGLIPAAHLRTGERADRYVTAYYGVAPSILRSLVERWQDRTAPARPIHDYTFFDVGAGKGRALLVAAEFPFRDILGIELNPTLAAIARANIGIGVDSFNTTADGRILPPIRLVEGDALAFPLDPVPTLACLFHPFSAAAWRIFLRRIEQTFAAHPGIFDLVYVNAEHLSVLRQHPAFSVLWEGSVPMSTEDHRADLEEIATQTEYGSTGDEHCAIARFVGRSQSQPLS